MVCSGGKITQEVDDTVYYKREAQVANTSILGVNLSESPLCPPHVLKYRFRSPHKEAAGKTLRALTQNQGNLHPVLMWSLLHAGDCNGRLRDAK